MSHLYELAYVIGGLTEAGGAVDVSTLAEAWPDGRADLFAMLTEHGSAEADEDYPIWLGLNDRREIATARLSQWGWIIHGFVTREIADDQAEADDHGSDGGTDAAGDSARSSQLGLRWVGTHNSSGRTH